MARGRMRRSEWNMGVGDVRNSWSYPVEYGTGDDPVASPVLTPWRIPLWEQHGRIFYP
jgi:hypothetical protein